MTEVRPGPPRSQASHPAPARPDAAPPPMRLTRRGVITLGGLGALTVVGGGLAVRSLLADDELPPTRPVTMTPERRVSPVPVAKDELQERRKVGSAAYIYEIDSKAWPYYVTPAFATKLDRWIALHSKEFDAPIDRITSYGAWVPGTSGSWHYSGEAFDVARLLAGGKEVASLRYDRWSTAGSAEVARRQRVYWRTVAGLHTEFADVLTYLYDANHHNHVHVDIGRFGPTGAPRLIERSEVQAQAIQAMCRYVWNRTDVQINGEYDRATRTATTDILRDYGGGELHQGAEAWRAFMLATLRRA